MTLPIDTIHCMDCFEGMAMLDSNSADMCITDPPYYIEALQKNLRQDTLRKSSKNNIFFNEFDHFKDLEDYKRFTMRYLEEIRRIVKPKGQIYLFCSYSHMDWIMGILRQLFRFYKPLIWYKPDTMGIFPNQYGCNYEPILWARKRAHPKNDSMYRFKNHIGCSQRDVFTIPSTNNQYRLECGFHPTPKPIQLIQKLIENSSNDGDVILDPFMGSGTTAVAAQNAARHFIGFEKNAEYVTIAARRLCQKSLLNLETFKYTTNTTNST